MRTVTISMRLPRDEVARLEKLAKELGTERPTLLKRACSLRKGYPVPGQLVDVGGDHMVVSPRPNGIAPLLVGHNKYDVRPIHPVLDSLRHVFLSPCIHDPEFCPGRRCTRWRTHLGT